VWCNIINAYILLNVFVNVVVFTTNLLSNQTPLFNALHHENKSLKRGSVYNYLVEGVVFWFVFFEVSYFNISRKYFASRNSLLKI